MGARFNNIREVFQAYYHEEHEIDATVTGCAETSGFQEQPPSWDICEKVFTVRRLP